MNDEQIITMNDACPQTGLNRQEVPNDGPRNAGDKENNARHDDPAPHHNLPTEKTVQGHAVEHHLTLTTN
jgi:hypothetical protein